MAAGPDDTPALQGDRWDRTVGHDAAETPASETGWVACGLDSTVSPAPSTKETTVCNRRPFALASLVAALA
jgi:hypothetical protein